MIFSKAQPFPSHANPVSRRAAATLLGLAAAGALFALDSAHAQNPQIPEPAASAAVAASSAAPAAQAPASAPRYAGSDLARAFGFMDGNHDGRVSREEAAGFRGVARHFDQADTNRDGFLSRKEFDAAMNYVKPQ